MRIHPTLDLPPEEMRQLGYKIIDLLVDHFASLPNGKTGAFATRSFLEPRLHEAMPQYGTAPETILKKLDEDVLSYSMSLNHPRFFGFIPSPSNFVSVLADLLASGFNVFSGNWLEGSGPSEIELIALGWLREICGFPKDGGGVIVDGGSIANLIALAVAREVKLPENYEKGMVYCSDQTHSSVEKAMRVLGFKPSQLRKLPSDENFRLRIADLMTEVEADRKQGKIAFCVVANAGTTNTGAVDPLAELAGYCRKEGLWLHVDGAYGAPARLCEEGRKALHGIEEADSLTVDPHKWLFQPYEIGCVFVRDSRLMQKAFRVVPEYLKDAELSPDEINFCDYGIQLTRSFKALKLWMSLKVFGVESFRVAVEKGFQLAALTEKTLRASKKFQVVTPAQLGIVSFRYQAGDEALQHQLVEAMLDEGFAVVSSTVLRGQTVIRMCTINPRTTEDDILNTVKRMEKIGDRLRIS